jgi:hypothetical protein
MHAVMDEQAQVIILKSRNQVAEFFNRDGFLTP